MFLLPMVFCQAVPALLALALKLSMLGHRKIPPYPRAFHSRALRHPHKLLFVVLVSYLLLLALGSNLLLMVFSVGKGFLLSLLLSGLGSARKHEHLIPRMMLTIADIVSLHYFYRKQ